MSAAVELQQLTKDFRTGWLGRRRRAVDAVSFDLPIGAVCGLIGPNGSGKSTTLKLLVGLLRPTAGGSRVLGAPAASVAVRRRIGYLPETAAGFAHATGEECLELAARLAGLTGRRVTDAVEAALTAVNLAALADRRLATYSKGQRQRLGLAQAIVHSPELLILDEPADGLDPDAAALFARIIRRQRAQGGTVLMASHQFDLLEAVCDHIAVLDRGQLRAAGPLAAVPCAEETSIDLAVEASAAVIAELRTWLGERGVLRPSPVPPGQRLARYYRDVLGLPAEPESA